MHRVNISGGKGQILVRLSFCVKRLWKDKPGITVTFPGRTGSQDSAGTKESGEMFGFLACLCVLLLSFSIPIPKAKKDKLGEAQHYHGLNVAPPNSSIINVIILRGRTFKR